MKRFNVRGNTVKSVCRLKFTPVFLLILLTLSFTTNTSAAELVVNGGFEEPDLATFPLISRGFDEGWTSFYGQNKPDSDPCTSHQDPLDPLNNWEVECNGNLKIPGWDVYWTDTFLAGTPVPGRLEIQNNILPIWANPVLAQLNADNGWFPAHPKYKNPITLARFGEQKAELDSHDRVNPQTGKPSRDNNVALVQSLNTCAYESYTFTYYWRSRTTRVGDNDVRVVVGDNIVRMHTLTDDWVKETVNFFADGSGITDIAFVSLGTGTQLGMSLDGVSVIGPAPDLLGNCPPPPSCEDDDSSDDGSSDDDSSDDNSCPAPWDDDSSDDGSSDDGSSDDGSSDDGSSDDGSSDDGSSDDGSSDDGSSDDDSSDDGDCGLCEDKPKFLTLVYDGDDVTSHAQDGSKVLITPEVVPGGLPTKAYIVATDKHGNVVGTSGLKAIGDTFDIPMQGSEVTLEIMDEGMVNTLQTVTFHISCSETLNVGDTFGGISIWGGHD